MVVVSDDEMILTYSADLSDVESESDGTDYTYLIVKILRNSKPLVSYGIRVNFYREARVQRVKYIQWVTEQTLNRILMMYNSMTALACFPLFT